MATFKSKIFPLQYDITRIIREIVTKEHRKYIDDIKKELFKEGSKVLREKYIKEYTPDKCLSGCVSLIENAIKEQISSKINNIVKQVSKGKSADISIHLPITYDALLKIEYSPIEGIKASIDIECGIGGTSTKIVSKAVDIHDVIEIWKSDIGEKYIDYTSPSFLVDILDKEPDSPNAMIKLMYRITFPEKTDTVTLYHTRINVKDYKEYLEKYREVILDVFKKYFKEENIEIIKCELQKETRKTDVYVCDVRYIPTSTYSTITITVHY